MDRRDFLTLVVSTLAASALGAVEKPRCSVCGMYVVDRPPHAYLGDRNGKATPFCSFACALAYRRKTPDAPLKAFASGSGKEIPADDAYYVIRSEKLASRFRFAMAPVVIAYALESDAKKAQAEAGDGEVVKGFQGVAERLGK